MRQTDSPPSSEPSGTESAPDQPEAPLTPKAAVSAALAEAIAEGAEQRAALKAAERAAEREKSKADKARKAAARKMAREAMKEAQAELRRNPPPPDLTPIQLEYADWLVGKDKSETKKAWAEAHGVSPALLCAWEKKPDFKRKMEEALDEVTGGVERMASVMNNMFKIAAGGTGPQAVAAAKLIMEYTKRMIPTTRVINDNAVQNMSDEELANQLQDQVRHLRAV